MHRRSTTRTRRITNYVFGGSRTGGPVASYQTTFSLEQIFQSAPATSAAPFSSAGSVFGFVNVFGNGILYLPQGYVSNTAISGDSSFLGNLGVLNLKAGSFDFVFGAGGPSRTITVVIPGNSVGGSVTGLSGSLVLQNNGADNLAVNSNGAFDFPRATGLR